MILSPAKVNLFLRVLSRREDGYHEIASLFQAVDLFDRLYYSFSEEDQLTCTDPSLLCDESNLILRALHLFRKHSGLRFFLKIHLEKNIPMEAGLGGGSSNAATVLFLCNALHGYPLKEEKLAELGAEIGSDVPFFFSDGSAYCTGRGELVETIDLLYNFKKIWLVKPSFGLATKLIYSHFNMESCSVVDPKFLLNHWLLGKYIGVNDLEQSAFHLMPKLEKLKCDLLEQGFESVFMTGSGTAFVCIGPNKPLIDSEMTCYSLSCIRRKEGGWY